MKIALIDYGSGNLQSAYKALELAGKHKKSKIFITSKSKDLLKADKEIIKPSDNLLEFAAGQYNDPKYQLGRHEWPALKRMLKKNNSIYDK